MGRVWTFVISKALSAGELRSLEEKGKAFVQGWTAHDVQLHASFQIFAGRILVIQVNEDIHQASGCSIDKLTRFIKDKEQAFSVQLLNRMLVAVKDGPAVKVLDAAEVKDLLNKKELSEDSVVYNTSAANTEELHNWEKPLKETWLKKYLTS